MSKLPLPDLEEYVKKHNVVDCIESKLDEYDSPTIDGYYYIKLIRKGCKRKSGGICVYIKDSLAGCTKHFRFNCMDKCI